MARRPRLEVEGGLYHLITRGVDRQDIFHDPRDFMKFLSLIGNQKDKLPFYLYAYCLMTNHVHLLIERRTDNVGRIMHPCANGLYPILQSEISSLGACAARPSQGHPLPECGEKGGGG